MARFSLVVLLALGLSCGDDDTGDVPDAAAEDAEVPEDANLPDPPDFTAEPDPDVLTGCQTDLPAAGTAMAKEVECAEELLPGSVAMGRVGDLVLQNDRIRVIVRTGDDAISTIGAYAGGLVDGAHHGGVDLIKDALFGLDFNSARPTAITITGAGGSEPARIRVNYDIDRLGLVRGVLGGAIGALPMAFGAIDYELRPGEDYVRVVLHVSPMAGTPRVVGRPRVIFLAGGGAELVQPEVGVLSDDELGASGNATMIAESFDGRSAYAMRILAPEGEGGVSHIDSIHLVSGGDRLRAMAGESDSYEVRFGFAPDAAAAHRAVTLDTGLPQDDALGTLVVTGDPGDRVEVLRDDLLLIRSRFDEAGRAELRLPTGEVQVRAGFGDFFQGATTTATVPGEIALDAAPRAHVEVNATADGAEAPVRITLVTAGRVLRVPALGPTRVDVPPGDVQVSVSRGVEYDLFQTEQTLAADETLPLTPDLARVVDTGGWVAGDFHLHSEMSTDSLHAVPDAVRIIAAEGLEVVAATDHDFINDYGPALAQTGMDAFVLAVSGVEVSDPIHAHINGYPVQRAPEVAGAGAPQWFDQTPLDTFPQLRGMEDPAMGPPVVQVNHPNRDSSGWFRAIGLDPVSGMATATPSELGFDASADLDDFDFDVVEVWNKSPDENDELSLQQLLGLWANGWRFGMMGNSDSHDSGRPAGSPRTYIAVPDDSPGAFAWSDVAASIRAGRMTVSGGAFVTAEPGEVAGDTVPVRVRVQVAPWAEVDRLRIYAGTEVVVDQPISVTGDVLVVDDTFDVALGGADFVLVRADGSRDADPVVPFVPYGCTNPIPVR